MGTFHVGRNVADGTQRYGRLFSRRHHEGDDDFGDDCVFVSLLAVAPLKFLGTTATRFRCGVCWIPIL